MTTQENTIIRSKIYTYFYGRKTVFQQFLIIVGVLMLMMATVAGSANYKSYNKKLDNFQQKVNDAYDAYYEIFSENNRFLNVSTYEKAYEFNLNDYYISLYGDPNTDYKEVVNEYNEALEKYEEAKADREKFAEKDPSDCFWAGFCRVIGYIAIAVGVLWFLYKKISFNKDGEAEYDDEIQRLIEAAKEKGIEKLGVVAEQINTVEPVVLNGVANTNGSNPMMRKNLLGMLFAPVLRFILSFGVIILGAIADGILFGIANSISKNNIVFTIVFILILALAAFVGKVIYKKFEIESFVSSKTIKKLERFYPRYMVKLGSDEAVRVSLPAIVVYMFSGEQLYVYTQHIDIVTGKIFGEGVKEFFYEDIVGVTSAQEVKKIFKRCGFLNLFLKSVDYMIESVSVVTKGCTLSEAYITDMNNSLLDTQFMGMRKLIRQKKIEK